MMVEVRAVVNRTSRSNPLQVLRHTAGAAEAFAKERTFFHRTTIASRPLTQVKIRDALGTTILTRRDTTRT